MGGLEAARREKPPFGPGRRQPLKTAPVEMPAKRRDELLGIDADDETNLTMRARRGRDRVDRLLGITRDEREYLERVPGVDFFGRRQAGFAPSGIDLGRIVTLGDLEIAHELSDPLGEVVRKP